MKKLLDQQNDNKTNAKDEEPVTVNTSTSVTHSSSSTTDQTDSTALINHTTPVPMDIDDIPIPTDNKTETTPVKLNEISLPTTNASNEVAATTTSTAPPLPPPVLQNTPKTPTIKINNSFGIGKKPEPKPKAKGVTKLPMPPGINQTDLEAIESPPSRSPTPPRVKPKTPPRKGIMNLPMPPGNNRIRI